MRFLQLHYKYYSPFESPARISCRPGEKLAGYDYDPGIGWDHQTGTYKPRYKPDYHQPGNLRRCTRCGQWNCQKHLHRGICATCAAKLGK